MNRPLVLFATIYAVILIAAISQDASASGIGFHGHVTLFAYDNDAPTGTYVRATIAGGSCGDAVVDAGGGYDLTVDASDVRCSADGAEIEFLWYRSDPSIATTCLPTATLVAGADNALDLICGQNGEFDATWIVTNTTSQVQRAVEVFPHVVMAGMGSAQIAGCGTPRTFAGYNIGGLLLVGHGEIVWPEACVAPSQTVRIGLGTDCPCHSELEIEHVVWMPAEPIFKANVDCDTDIDAGDALQDLLLSIEATVSTTDCPGAGQWHYPAPNALSGVWGDINCDRVVNGTDVVYILRLTLNLPAGISNDCWAEYYPAPIP